VIWGLTFRMFQGLVSNLRGAASQPPD
jgi:hypothetical protein